MSELPKIDVDAVMPVDGLQEAEIVLPGWADYMDTRPAAVSVDLRETDIAFRHILRGSSNWISAGSITYRIAYRIDYQPHEDGPEIDISTRFGSRLAWWHRGAGTTDLRTVPVGFERTFMNEILERLDDPWSIKITANCNYHERIARDMESTTVISAIRIRGSVSYTI